MVAKKQPAQKKPAPAKPVHQFGKARPSSDGNFHMHVASTQEARDTHYRPLPDPPGTAPYQLDLASLVPAESISAMRKAGKITFHVNGDIGGIKTGVNQQLVAQGMEDDFATGTSPENTPSFLYVLGDCVYYNGQIAEYRAQFYEPYTHYQAPIFAVPGNHDGENLPEDHTLDGFMKFFCASSPAIPPEAGDTGRTTMTQPNVYWTLRTPLASIIGVYSNVPEGGDIRSPQLEWLVDQLKTLPKSLPLLVALHHPVYSADNHHSGSTHMKQLLEQAAQEAGRHPDMVMAGHVHDYQRITKDNGDGTVIPYLVVGGGGYFNLHTIIKVDGQKLVAPATFQDKSGETVTLEKYCDDHHGFLRMEITDTLITGRYFAVPRPQEPFSKGNTLIDYFEYDWKAHQYRPNLLLAPGAAPPKKGRAPRK